MSRANVFNIPFSTITAKLSDFFKRFKNQEFEFIEELNADRNNNPEAMARIVSNSIGNEEYLSELVFKTAPIKFTDDIAKLTYGNEFPLTDPVKQVSENYTKLSRQVKSYVMLVEYYCTSTRSIAKRHYRTMLAVGDALDENDTVEAELLAAPMLVEMSNSLKRIKLPSSIINKLEPINSFNNTRIVSNKASQYPIAVSEKLSKLSIKEIRPLTLEEVLAFSKLIVYLLEIEKSLDKELYHYLKSLKKEDTETLDRLLDTGLSEEVRPILERLEFEPLLNMFFLPIDKVDIFEIISGILAWVKESIEIKR